MTLLSITFEGADVATKWLDALPPKLRRSMETALRDASGLVVQVGQRITQEEDAIGASRAYLAGWKYEINDIRADSGSATVFNDSGHEWFVEHGRKPGAMPPKDDIERWMIARGIPLEFSFPIRRAIAESGTVKRKGYKGFAIMERTVDMAKDDVLDILAAGVDRALAGMR